MEKEIDIYRENVAEYFAWQPTLIIFITTVWFFGLGLIAALVYRRGIAVWLSPMQAQALKYTLDDKTLRIDSGVYFLRRKAIPLDRITDITLVQGPLMRFTPMISGGCKYKPPGLERRPPRPSFTASAIPSRFAKKSWPNAMPTSPQKKYRESLSRFNFDFWHCLHKAFA